MAPTTVTIIISAILIAAILAILIAAILLIFLPKSDPDDERNPSVNLVAVTALVGSVILVASGLIRVLS